MKDGADGQASPHYHSVYALCAKDA